MAPRPRTLQQAYELLLNEAIQEGSCLVVYGRCTKAAGHVRLSVMGKSDSAHRIVWHFHNGDILPGKVIMHSCDRPACVNIEHLSLGTHKENILDMHRKGRNSKGEEHINALFTEDAIHYIRGSSVPGTDLAKVYNCSPNTIYAIRKRRSWKHLE